MQGEVRGFKVTSASSSIPGAQAPLSITVKYSHLIPS